jgi:hypothetical protein
MPRAGTTLPRSSGTRADAYPLLACITVLVRISPLGVEMSHFLPTCSDGLETAVTGV